MIPARLPEHSSRSITRTPRLLVRKREEHHDGAAGSTTPPHGPELELAHANNRRDKEKGKDQLWQDLAPAAAERALARELCWICWLHVRECRSPKWSKLRRSVG